MPHLRISRLLKLQVNEQIALWITKRNIEFAYQKRIAIQYATYIHHEQKTVDDLLKNTWIVEAKHEDLSALPFSEDTSTRIRISFYVDSLKTLRDALKKISEICDNEDYGVEILDVLSWFEQHHKMIFVSGDKKVLEGVWNEDTRWEFYLSDTLPDPTLCSAAFGIPKFGNGFVLTKTQRGWELPGGHREEKETVIKSMERELLEEAGFVVDRYLLYGHLKIIAFKLSLNQPLRPKGAEYDRSAG